MNDLKRLLLSDASEKERRLLQAGASEEPPADGARRLAVALGLGSGPSGRPPQAEGSAAEHEAQAGTASAAGHVARTGMTKWLALTSAGLLAVAGTTLFIRSQPKTQPAAGREERAAVVSQPSGADVRIEARAQRSEGEGQPSQPSAAAPLGSANGANSTRLASPPVADGAARPGRSAPSGARAKNGDGAAAPASPEVAAGPAPSLSEPGRGARSIAQEIAQLELVRGLLREGSASAALRELSLYDARHAHGALREEADVMRIETLVLAGQPEVAKRLAERFTRQHAASVHHARVRALLRSLDAR